MKESTSEAARLIAQINREDDLLERRLGIFLTINIAAAVAAGVEPTALGRSGLEFFAVVVNGLWMLCSLHARRMRKFLVREYSNIERNSVFIAIAEESAGNQPCLRPIVILGLYLPLVLLVTWMTVSSNNFMQFCRAPDTHIVPTPGTVHIPAVR